MFSVIFALGVPTSPPAAPLLVKERLIHVLLNRGLTLIRASGASPWQGEVRRGSATL